MVMIFALKFLVTPLLIFAWGDTEEALEGSCEA